MGGLISNRIMDDPWYIWQDRDIRFDCNGEELNYRRGELEVDRADNIEDTRAYPGEVGYLIATNLRVIWRSRSKPMLNVSIGYNTIANVTIHTTGGKTRGLTQALFILTKIGEERLEFSFTNIQKNNSPRVFISVQGLLSRYETSRLYRDIFTRGVARIKDNNLLLLPKEEVSTRVNNIWCSSLTLLDTSDTSRGSRQLKKQKNQSKSILGAMILTNVRMVWFSNTKEGCNISVPYFQMRRIRLTKNEKTYQEFQIETVPQVAMYTFTFRHDHAMGISSDLIEEINSLYDVYSNNPIFGVDYKLVDRAPSIAQFRVVVKDNSVSNLIVKTHLV